MVFDNTTSAGFDVYKLIIPVTKMKFYSAGVISEIDVSIKIVRRGRDVKSERSFRTSSNLVDYFLLYPADGDLVGREPKFNWNARYPANSEDKVEIFICRNWDLKDKWIGGCKIIKLDDKYVNSLNDSKIPKLNKGVWWWGIKVSSPVYFFNWHWGYSDPHYTSSINSFEVGNIADDEYDNTPEDNLSEPDQDEEYESEKEFSEDSNDLPSLSIWVEGTAVFRSEIKNDPGFSFPIGWSIYGDDGFYRSVGTRPNTSNQWC